MEGRSGNDKEEPWTDREKLRPAGGTRTPGKATCSGETLAWSPVARRPGWLCERAEYACVRVPATPSTAPHPSSLPPPPLSPPSVPSPALSRGSGGSSRAAFRAASRCPGGGGEGASSLRGFNFPASQSRVLLILPILVPIAGLPPRHLQFLLPGWAEGNSWALLPSVVVIRRLKCS